MLDFSQAFRLPGTTYDFFVQILKLFKPRLTLLEIPGWATDESMEIWPGSMVKTISVFCFF